MSNRAFSVLSRAAELESAATEELDVLVVGMGATRAGVALDAASRGLRVAVLDKGDLASGTSSKSSKLVHGGLRYLEMFDFKLVREALEERGLLLTRLAPHLVRPVPFLYPLTSHHERPYVGAGLALYDSLAAASPYPRGVPLHRHLTKRKALRVVPDLKPEALTGAALGASRGDACGGASAAAGGENSPTETAIAASAVRARLWGVRFTGGPPSL